MTKKNKPHPQAQQSYGKLSNPLSSKLLSEQSYLQNLANFMAYEQDSLFDERYSKLMEKARFCEAMRWSATNFSDLFERKVFRDRISVSRMWSMYRITMKKNAPQITQFAYLRDEIERSFFTGDYEAAHALLDTCEEQFGESFWLVRTRGLVLSEQGRSEELKAMYEEHKTVTADSIFAFILNSFQLITDSDDPSLHLKTLIYRNVNEFTEAKIPEAAALLEVLFVPSPLKRVVEFRDCFPRIQSFPLVDQYHLLLQLIQRDVAEHICTGAELDSQLRLTVNVLSAAIKDPLLLQAESSLVGKYNSAMSKAGIDLFEQYNRGEYQAVVDSFSANIAALDNPLAYINLVAKSHAYIGDSETIATSGTVIEQLIQNLALIYSMSPLWLQAEESITSSAVKYWSFPRSAHVQLTLYKAIPNRYPDLDRRIAAALAAVTHAETTPLVDKILAKGIGATGVDGFGNDDESIPLYRKIKQRIASAIDKPEAGQDLEQDLQALKQAAPLVKDYLEVYGAYCLSSRNEESLISLVAQTLVEEIRSLQCFPMMHLLRQIESERLCSVDAVVVAYYGTKHISPDKDYVLNEAFEEYIQDKGARKPSEILGVLGDLSPVEIVFYRDVCVPEVMDFLSCFKNTNELRAERVRILDILLEKEVLDSDTRMSEVEEIVGQVIVDAGTSEFNGPKIYVDDVALRKKHAEEVRALLSIYKQAKDTNEDRVTMIGDEANGTLQAYLSGTKNAIILRIFNLLNRAFLHDEKHGLDKNLSAEIRHGFFSNLMRARLEERRLITEIDDNGRYKSNTYWIQHAYLVRGEILEEVDECLRRFSADFNALVAEAEEWMKIATTIDQTLRVFNFNISTEEFEHIKESIERSQDADKVTGYLLQWMWDRVDEHLDTIREKINGEFRDRVDLLFDKLEGEIRTAKRGVAFADLMTAIGHARNEIKEDISTAAEWFKRTETPEIEARTLDKLVEIAINSFEKVKGAAFGIAKSIPLEFRDVSIAAGQAKPFIIAITNLLDNCYRHSGLGQATRVEISGGMANGGALIEIKNDVSADKRQVLGSEFIDSIHLKMRAPDTAELMRTEGGSGIIKAHNLITSLGSRSCVNFSCDDASFTAGVQYAN